MEKVAEKSEGSRLGGRPETRTSMLPPIDCNDDGFKETIVATESSTTVKKGEVQEMVKPLEAVTETLTANTFTEEGAFTRIVATVVDEFDGSKKELRTVTGMSSKGAG